MTDQSEPAYVIPPESIGFVVYHSRHAVGLQLVDPNGETVLLPLSGEMLRALRNGLDRLEKSHPDVYLWEQHIPDSIR